MSNIPDHWEVRRLAGALGAEVHGPDIGNVSPEDIEAIKSILLEHMVIFLPDQSPTVEAHISFGRHFGELEGHPNLSSDTSLPPELFQTPCGRPHCQAVTPEAAVTSHLWNPWLGPQRGSSCETVFPLGHTYGEASAFPAAASHIR